MKKSNIYRSLLIIFLTFLLQNTGFSQVSATERLVHLNVKKSLAIEGYDPVAYFRHTGPQKGLPSIVYQYMGVTYHFSIEENKMAFMAEP